MIVLLGTLTFAIAIIIYILIALGFPLGEFAMGGKYKVMPAPMRIACGISVFIQLFAVIILLQTASMIPLFFSMKVTRGICFFFAAYLSLNVLLNASSNSKKEKIFVTPLSLISAICFWLTGFLA